LTLGVFLAVLGAAFLHALWNALIKMGTSKVGGMVILSIVEVPIGLAVVLFTDAIDRAAIPWVLAAGCTHFAYKFFLTYAYDRGDLSRVYPIARGAAPMVVALVGAAFLADAVSGKEYVAIAVLAAGILLMARGVFASGEDRRLLPFAFGSALATATYTLIDGMGARVSGAPAAYVAWVFVADGCFFTLGMLALRGWDVIPRNRHARRMGSLASAASYGAYAVSIWAMT
jgi:drug/metabolite transporter (DMT)-like permease